VTRPGERHAHIDRFRVRHKRDQSAEDDIVLVARIAPRTSQSSSLMHSRDGPILVIRPRRAAAAPTTLGAGFTLHIGSAGQRWVSGRSGTRQRTSNDSQGPRSTVGVVPKSHNRKGKTDDEDR